MESGIPISGIETEDNRRRSAISFLPGGVHRQKLFEAFSSVLPDEIDQYYIKVYTEDKVVAVSSLQRYDFDISSYVKPDAGRNFFSSILIRAFLKGSLFLNGDIWVLGHLMLSGIKYRSQSEEIQSLFESDLDFWMVVMESFRTTGFSGPNVRAMGIIQRGELGTVPGSGFPQWNFFPVEPLMRLDIDPDWRDFKDYLDAFRSRYRTKVNQVLRRSESIAVRKLTLEETEKHNATMMKLHARLLKGISFNVVEPPGDILISLKQQLGPAYNITGFFERDKLVGFLSAIEVNSTTEGHLLGYDKKLGEEKDLYKFILLTLVKQAIQAKSRRVYFGRTASIAKINIGANPQRSGIWFRPVHPLVRMFMPLYYKTLYKAEMPRPRNTFKRE